MFQVEKPLAILGFRSSRVQPPPRMIHGQDSERAYEHTEELSVFFLFHPSSAQTNSDQIWFFGHDAAALQMRVHVSHRVIPLVEPLR